MATSKREGSLSDRVLSILIDTLENSFSPSIDRKKVESRFAREIEDAPRANLQRILDKVTAKRSYRVVAIIQLAFGLASEARLNLTLRHPGTRGASGVAGRIGRFLMDHHVAAPDDAYQNLGKNFDNLVRGNFAEYDAFLRWAAEEKRTKAQLRAALDFACLRIADSARPILPFPEIVNDRLTFAATTGLFIEMIGTGSRGAHEQFITAALLHARVLQESGSQTVVTKDMNASDESSRTAADIQVRLGTRVVEAFEVTANPWIDKLSGATATMRAHDLARLHILAKVDDIPKMLADLGKLTEDISAIDLRAYFCVLTAELRKQFRAAALKRLYELLDRYQSDNKLVNDYVNLLKLTFRTSGVDYFRISGPAVREPTAECYFIGVGQAVNELGQNSANQYRA